VIQTKLKTLQRVLGLRAGAGLSRGAHWARDARKQGVGDRALGHTRAPARSTRRQGRGGGGARRAEEPCRGGCAGLGRGCVGVGGRGGRATADRPVRRGRRAPGRLGAPRSGRKGGERGGGGEGQAYHGLDGRQQPLTGDPNEGRERVGERRLRERVVSLLLDHGCEGKGSGGGGVHGGSDLSTRDSHGLSRGADSSSTRARLLLIKFI
jgi:hypothetical protein